MTRSRAGGERIANSIMAEYYKQRSDDSGRIPASFPQPVDRELRLQPRNCRSGNRQWRCGPDRDRSPLHQQPRRRHVRLVQPRGSERIHRFSDVRTLPIVTIGRGNFELLEYVVRGCPMRVTATTLVVCLAVVYIRYRFPLGEAVNVFAMPLRKS